MKTQSELRIYPARKYIMTPSNTSDYDQIKQFVETVLSENNVVSDSLLNKMYDHLRATLISRNVIYFGKDKVSDDICIYEFDVNVNDCFRFGGYDEPGIPYLEMLS